MYTFLYVSAENKVFLTFKDQISPLLQKNPADWRDSLLLHVDSHSNYDFAGFFKVFIF